MIRFKCPSCPETVTLSTGRSGEKVVCPHCDLPVTVPAEVQSIKSVRETAPVKATPTALVKKPDSALKQPEESELGETTSKAALVPCPHCRASVSVTSSQLNRSIRCNSCRKQFVVHFGIQPTPETGLEVANPELKAELERAAERSVVSPPPPTSTAETAVDSCSSIGTVDPLAAYLCLLREGI